jgi:hypothetical protein
LQVLSVLFDAASTKWCSIGPVLMFTSLPVVASTISGSTAISLQPLHGLATLVLISLLIIPALA